MIELYEAVRAHLKLEQIINGNCSEYLKPTVLYSSVDHKLAAAYEDLGANSLKYSELKPKMNYSYRPKPKPMFSSIKVDGQEVATTSFKKTKTNWGEEQVLSHFVDEDAIRKFATAAPFGRGDQTVYDDNVRKALEIEASRIEIEYGPEFAAQVISGLEKLAPRGKQLIPMLYKMHVYEAGGHFARHRDTLHADNHHATLIIALPTEYEGGDFILHVDGEAISFDMNGTREDDTNECLCFLTDLPHEVCEVKNGTRIVVQYDLYLEDASTKKNDSTTNQISKSKDYSDDDMSDVDMSDDDMSDDDDGPDFSEASALEKPRMPVMISLAEAQKTNENGAQNILPLLEDFMNKKQNESVCFLLTHQYPLAIKADMLKAGDRVLHDLISSKYEVELGLAFNRVETDYDGKFPSEEKAKNLSVMDFGCIQALRKYASGTMSDKESSLAVHVFVGSSTYLRSVKCEHYQEYTGNEACPGEYVYASVVLAVGPRRDR